MPRAACRQSSLDRVARGVGVATGLLGAATMLGWLLRVDVLTSLVPGLISMKANTAFCFIAAGAAVGSLPDRRLRGPVRGLAAVVLAVAAATAIEYATGRDCGIDELLFRDPASARNGLPPGRMALATALAFLVVGAAILLIERGRLVVAQSLTFVAMLVALFSLTAYLFGEGALTMSTPYTSLAVHTAVGIFVLGVGLLSRCTAAGPMTVFVADDLGGVSLRRLLPMTIMTTILMGLASAAGAKVGLYGPRTGMVLFATAAMVVLAAAIWDNSRSLSRSEAERRDDLERFRHTLASIGDGVIATDRLGRVVFLNAVAEGLTGWSSARALGRPLDEVFRVINQATRRPVESSGGAVLATGRMVGSTTPLLLVAPDGTEQPIEANAFPIRGDDRTTTGVVLVCHNVAAKQRSERILAEQRHILELIGRGGETGPVLEALCRMIGGPAREPVLASILLVGADGLRWSLGAGPGMPPGYAGAVEGVAMAHGIASCGPGGQRTGPVYAADIAADPLWAGFADLARAHDLRDCWSCPILSTRDEVLGILALFRRQPRPPSAEELEVVDIVTRTAAIAIERDRSRAELVDARTRLESTLSAGMIGTWTWDLVRDWAVPDANLIRLFASPPEAAAGAPSSEFLRSVHPDDLARVEQAIGDAIAVTGRYNVEYRLLPADGEARLVEARGTVQYDPTSRPLSLSGVVIDVTDRRRVEQEKDQFAHLIENSGDFIGIATLDGMPTYVNATGRRMMGIDDWESARLIPLAEYFFPEDLPYLLGEFLPRARAQGYARAEVRLRHFRTGEAIWTDYAVTLLRSWEGTPTALATISRDLTEQRRADAERRVYAARAESQARLFDSALSNSPDHAFTVDLDGRFTYANKVLLALWRKTADEVVGKTLFELDYPIELATRIHGQIRQVIAAGSRIVDETPFVANGGTGIFEYILAPVLSPDGAVEAVAGASRDITERKQAERAAQLRAGRMQRLAGISARINAAHDVDSVIRVVNREALDLFGTRRAAISMVLNPDFPQPVNVVATAGDGHGDGADAGPTGAAAPEVDAATLAEILSQASEPIRLTEAEIEADPRWRSLRRLGGNTPARSGWLAAPLVSRDRKTMGLIQLSDKQEGEFTGEDEALLVQLSLLAAIAIENARLYEELRGNDRRKDEFLAMLAHELRNPLAAISNATKLLTRAGFEQHGEWSLEVITRQMQHLTRLIDELLDVSRISRGKITLRRDLIEATPVLDSAAATVRGLVEERKHTLEVAIDRGNLWLGADPTRLEQVVVNLLNNAAKYSENAGLIRLEARNEGDQVVIRVEDRGVGIPPEQLPQMFELFAQGDRSLARSEGGLGIGLTVVKKLVELHGGTIAARSDGPGRGSEFTIRLPAAAPPPAAPAPAVPAEAPAPAEARKARILVVDDNVDTARGMARLLKLIGHSIATAHSGPDAIEAARRHHPEVVLLDIGLPGMSGYEVAAQLRREANCRGALIIAVSGYGQDEDRRRSREAGFDHHLIKPLDHDALLALLAGA